MKLLFKRIFVLLVIFLTALNGFSASIILTSDQQLNDLLDPDKKIDMSTGFTKRIASLRDVCEDAQKRGDKTLTIAFDEFFRQYRNQKETVRLLTPDSDEYVEKIKVIADFAATYGMGMGLSLLSPLELGPAFQKQTGKTGKWLHYKVGLRDAKSGKFNVQLWQQLYWTNNKGKFPIKLKGVKAYAFKEQRLKNSPFKAVDRDDIFEIKAVEFEEWGVAEENLEATSKMETEQWSSTSSTNAAGSKAKRVSVFSNGSDELEGYDNVLVVLEYDVPEMEYFSKEAAPFLKNLLKKYHDNGIKIKHFYSDEMHIQQDWMYFSHHDNGQLAVRYYTEAFGDLYTETFGVPFEQKDILYFAYGPNINSNHADASTNIQYVRGETREDIQQTYLFRDRYYKMLNNRVTDLFKNAKAYASELFGVDDFGTHGHSSWAESPTVDLWDVGELQRHPYKYEYTFNFIWGNTVHQAAAACYDYFKWGEYLEPTRNDFAELGWNDRNYYGAAMSASLGVLNKIPNSYPAFWGMPAEVKERKGAINDAFGGAPKSKTIDLISGHVHRDVDVLMLYPMNLVAAEERFGSWITQYGYANFITAEKLLELATVNETGEIQIKDKKYTTLVALFEPIPQKGVLDLMDKLSEKGGNSIWFGPPPIINGAGEKCLAKWETIFGVKYTSPFLQGQIASGKRIDFMNQFESIPEQYILTDFLVDRIYPVEVENGTAELAFCDNTLLVGTGNDNAYYFGFRPRDDQSASLGYETRTLFEILDKIGVYKPSGRFAGINDNTEHISRTSDYLATRFPNNTTILVRHYRTQKENWEGGFSRNLENDKKFLEKNPLPTDTISIKNFKVNGHEVSFDGKLTMAFRMNEQNELIAFEGKSCKQISIDGKTYPFSKDPVQKIAFAPSLDKNTKAIKIFVEGEANITLPLSKDIDLKNLKLINSRGEKVKHKTLSNSIQFAVTSKLSGEWLTLK
jgi:hypothetical protein